MPNNVDVTVTRVMRTQRQALAEFCADMSNAPLWYQNIQSVDWQTSPSSNVGARAAFVAQFMGRRLSYTYEIIEHIPGERLVMSTQNGPFPMQTIYEWDDVSKSRTRMRLTNRGFPAGFKAVLMPVMGLAMRRAMTKDLKALADRME